MMIHEITAKAGKYKACKRVGRGEGSGHGKQSGRGNKGAGSRSGTSAKIGFEGGQMRYFRRMPKFGFTNAAFKTQYWTVNIGDIIAHADFAKGGKVTTDSLIKAGLVRDASRDLKILGHLKDAKGSKNLAVKLDVEAARVSDSARKLIVDAGGKVNQTGSRRDKVRGVDRNSDDRSPKNLTKKLKRNTNTKAKAAVEAEAPAEEPKAKKGGDKPAKAEKAPKAPKGE